MSKHVHDWLQAYYDGELRGRQLARVEAHLAECEWCQKELDKLSALSALLQESPPAEITTRPEQFVAQVGMRLPRRPIKPMWQQTLQAGWTFAPLALFLVLAFTRTAVWIANLVTEVKLTGVGGEQVRGLLAGLQTGGGGWQLPIAAPEFGFSELLEFIPGFFGLSGSLGIDWTLGLVLPVVIGLLSLSWVAGWWVTQNGKS